MKTLLLMRHGKSSWSQPDLPDHDRPLTKRGRSAAKQMGKWLQDHDLVPDHVLTSTACRAFETAALTADAAKYRNELEPISELYHAEPDELIAVLSRVPDQFNRVLIVGHNPGLEEWLAELIGRTETFPTAALAHLELKINSWADLTLDTQAQLLALWRPRDL